MRESNLTLAIASSGCDGFHIIVVTLGEKIIHRDGLFVDRADNRRQFIDDLVRKLPAITDGAEVSPDEVDAQLIALASKASSQVTRQSPRKFGSVPPGTKVQAGAPDNIGDAKSEPFPVDLLPSVVRQYVVEGAEARAADPSIVALPVLVTLAACIGMTRRIAPKKDWTAPAILWGAVVARSGSVKSVGYDLAHELLKPSEDVNHRDHLAAKDTFRLAEMEHRKAVSLWSKSKDEGEPPEPPEPPIAKRLVVDDQTVESLAPLLAENPRGLFLLADELRGWFDGMGAYSSSSRSGGGRDEARWLALFEGRSFNVDRKTNRERIYISEAGVSVAGTIQPGTLTGVVCGGQVESGLLARLLLVMPEPRAKKWTDTEMTETTQLAMQRVIDQLKALEHNIADEAPKAIILPLTNEAKQRFIRFVNSHGAETITHGDALAAAWSKLEGYALRFALVVHLAKWASGAPDCKSDGPVGIESIEAGIELSRWFANEAERVYGRIGVTPETGEDGNDRHVARLAEWLQSKGGSATEREIARGPRRYRGEENAQHIKNDCSVLVDAGDAHWDVSRKTRRIVLLDAGDPGDGDAWVENAGKQADVSPNRRPSVTTDPATLAWENGDTCAEQTDKIKQVSPSPVVSPPSTSSERVRVTI
ncbi:DUF3987 domain-containing protein [Rosistilla oblonga]|uniref:DUF3987 domain-containing protein n=1 Tax=Rosistilla oblonga TaxID=2527990 RepID=A0A518IVU1_9BACT|nr:DUF3987 domain-containing protein [Rosistilla oblonga]QDV57203.1 hypothetical protein Mal33_32060 [Rosistilla oblonga]